MIELINNTLKIICRLSNSNAGFLSMLNYGTAETVTSCGDIKEIIDPVNNKLLENYVSGKSSYDNPGDFNFIHSLNSSFPLKSFFIEKLFSGKNQTAFFLVLVSPEENNYGNGLKHKIMPAVEIMIENLKLIKNNQNTKIGLLEFNKEYILKHYREFFNLLLEVSEDFIFILDGNGRFAALNDFGLSLLDHERHELIGKHFLEFVPIRDKSAAAEAFDRIIKQNQIVTFETPFLSKYGKEILFEINGNALVEDGKISGVLGVGKNITESRVFEEKINRLNTSLIEANRIISVERQRSIRQKSILYELNNMKSNFLSNISHELRTPLASIIGFAETVASDREMPDDMKYEFNGIILSEAKRLAKLINDVLDISRIESGRLELKKNDTDIVKIIKEVIENNISGIEKKNITLTADLPKESVILKVDEERMSQVLNGLLINAVKFTGQNGRIAISGREFYKEFELTVSDTGIGIPSKDLPYIFQKFYKVNRPGVQLPGTGLGLVFVKQIVDLHKGYITILSDVNKGTTIILKLPKTPKL